MIFVVAQCPMPNVVVYWSGVGVGNKYYIYILYDYYYDWMNEFNYNYYNISYLKSS